MENRPPVSSPSLCTSAIVVLAVVVGLVSVVAIDRSGEHGSGLGDAFDYQIEGYRKIDPALIRYRQTAEIPSQMQQARAVAVGPLDRIYLAGDHVVRVLEPDGTLRSEIALGQPPERPRRTPPRCLAVGGREHAVPGQIYVGFDHHVEVIDPEGKPVASWNNLGEKGLLTSIAVAEEDIFVADAGNRIVLRYDTEGNLIGRIGAPDKDRRIHGFVIPSPFFDVAVGPDGLLRVVNPGALRIETYTFDGYLEQVWGHPAADVEGFFGCCNPANIALLADGRIVTAEKGLLRVKVYTTDGRLDCVVAGPDELGCPTSIIGDGRSDHEYTAVDVAVDSAGRILVLDLANGNLRVFEPVEDDRRDQ